MTEQQHLFNPQTTEKPRCKVRGCTAGTRKNLCMHDADIAHGVREPYARRPGGCLKKFDFMVPDDQPLPY